MKKSNAQQLLRSNFVQVSPACWTGERYEWEVQDRESCAIPRDFTRPSHSPHVLGPREGWPCLV